MQTLDRCDCAICREQWQQGEHICHNHPRFGTSHTDCIRAVLDAEQFTGAWQLYCVAKIDQAKGWG